MYAPNMHQRYRQFFIFISCPSRRRSFNIPIYVKLFSVYNLAEGHAIFAYFSTYFVYLMNFVIFLITISSLSLECYFFSVVIPHSPTQLFLFYCLCVKIKICACINLIVVSYISKERNKYFMENCSIRKLFC